MIEFEQRSGPKHKKALLMSLFKKKFFPPMVWTVKKQNWISVCFKKRKWVMYQGLSMHVLNIHVSVETELM